MKKSLALILLALTWPAWAKDLDVSLFRDNGSGKPGEKVTFFKPGDRKIHFLAKMDGLKVGKTQARVVFTGVETSAGKNVTIKEIDVGNSLLANQVTAALSLPRDWPFGTYKADFYIDGKLATSRPYTISPAVEELKALGYRLLEDDGKGKPGKVVKAFKPTDHKLHFNVEVNGYFMGKALVQWHFTAVDTSKGQNVDLGTQDFDATNQAGNTLTSVFELPRDWPKGTYRADVSINKRKIQTIDYKIQ